MIVEDWLYAKLVTVMGTDVYPVEAPPNTAPPYCVYRQVSGDTEQQTNSTTVHRDRWQIDTYPENYRAGKTPGRANQSRDSELWVNQRGMRA